MKKFGGFRKFIYIDELQKEKQMNVSKERYKIFKNKAKDLYGSFDNQECFLVGAVWADQHPIEGLVKLEDVIDKACDWIEQHVSEYFGRSEYMATEFREYITKQYNKHDY